MAETIQILARELAFPEGIRWHEGKFWYSDMARKVVAVVGLDGHSEVVASLDDRPSGLGFLPDGTPLVVSMYHKKLFRISGGGLELHADLADLPGDFINDMVVDADGRSYVGTRSASLHVGKTAQVGSSPDTIVIVDRDGTASVGATGLISTNGMIVSPDGSTLIVAETYAQRLTAFDRAADGSLSRRRVFALTLGAYPDGICLDSNGAVWVASLYSDEFIRVRDGGEITDRIRLAAPLSCVFGGANRDVLALCCGDPSVITPPGEKRPTGIDWSGPLNGGYIATTHVGGTGAGWP